MRGSPQRQRDVRCQFSVIFHQGYVCLQGKGISFKASDMPVMIQTLPERLWTRRISEIAAAKTRSFPWLIVINCRHFDHFNGDHQCGETRIEGIGGMRV